MTTNFRPPYKSLLPLYLLMAMTTALLVACATVSRPQVLDRNSVPAVKTEVPPNESEIREITFHAKSEEKGHQDLHLVGQLFKKAQVNGTTLISPCAGCLVSLGNPADSTAKATMVTEQDGYFDFDGKLPFNTITVTASDHNKLELNDVSFEHGGITTMKLILAPGSNNERFVLNKNAKRFSWSRL